MAAVCSGSSEAVFALLEEKATASARHKAYGTPLEKAVSMGQAWKDIVTVLVEYGAQADLSPTDNGVHILHRAAMYGMNELVKYCLSQNCQIDLVTTKGPSYNPKSRFNWFAREMTPLAYACAEGHVAVVKTLLERGAPFELDKPFSAPLWVAAYQGLANVVDLMLETFRAKHSEDDTISFMDHLPHPDAGRHFILFAAASSGKADVVRILLDYHAPYRSNWFGATLLLASATYGAPAVTQVLLDYYKDGKVDVCLDQRNGIGRTALYEACVLSRSEVASHLLNAGADLFIPNDQNATVLHSVRYDMNYKLIEQVVNKASESANPEIFLKFLNTHISTTGNTALMECAARSRLPSLMLLLDRGANPLLSNKENETALHFACRQGNFSIVEKLVGKALEIPDPTNFQKFIDQQPSSHT